MTLADYLDGGGLTPELAGIAGRLDGARRDEPTARMPVNKIETRLQGAMRDALYPLAVTGDVALSFTYRSRVFLVETPMKSEIAFDADRALECAPAGERGGLRAEYDQRVLLAGIGLVWVCPRLIRSNQPIRTMHKSLFGDLIHKSAGPMAALQV